LQAFLKKAVNIDKVLKGARKGNAWNELTWFLLGIADVHFRTTYNQ